MNTAIFIMSCDNTRDVLTHFIKGFNLFWKDNLLPVFLGSNDLTQPENFNNSVLLQVPKSNWKKETIEQLSLLQNIDPTLSHVIVFLDDFILNKNVDNKKILTTLNYVKLHNIKYLRLKRLEEGFVKKLFHNFQIEKNISTDKIFRIRKSHPYFSSLQIAIWEINYLKSCIENCKNIWHFELQKNNQCEHYSVLDNLFSYRHIVEKGKWETYASLYCKKYIHYFNPGNREFQSLKFQNKIINFIKKIKFIIFGYTFSSYK